MSDAFVSFLTQAIDEYVQCAREGFFARMNEWNRDIFDNEVNEVVGGLLARQMSLARTLAQSPQVWNPHILPVVLRCMADVYITFCWIVKDVNARSRQFVEYGLGQEKLVLEKYREYLAKESEPDPDVLAMVDDRERTLDAERYRFLIPVNVGSWSERNTRDMAKEVEEEQFYDFVFTQCSPAVHSTWQHIWQTNLHPCSNPLHMGHRLPVDLEFPPDLHMFTNSAKYLCKTFAKFDSQILGQKSESNAYQCFDLICTRFAAYFSHECPESDKPVPPAWED